MLKTASSSTIFIYILGSKTLWSSLTSQIAAKNAANCNARLKNRLLQIYPLQQILSYSFNIIFIFLYSCILSIFNTYFLIYTVLYISLLIVLYINLILIEFGYRHRALRSNLLSKECSKVFPLQSLTQNHLLIESFIYF